MALRLIHVNDYPTIIVSAIEIVINPDKQGVNSSLSDIIKCGILIDIDVFLIVAGFTIGAKGTFCFKEAFCLTD